MGKRIFFSILGTSMQPKDAQPNDSGHVPGSEGIPGEPASDESRTAENRRVLGLLKKPF